MRNPPYKLVEAQALTKNCVLERINKTIDGVKYKYDLYSNTHSIGSLHENLNEVLDQLDQY